MTTLLLVHMSWGIGHVSPKYPLQRRLSGRTIETQRSICTNAPRFPCSNYFTVHRMIQEHFQKVQKVLSFWKGGALSSTKASFTGLAPSSCPLLKTVPQDHFIPCLSLCQQHFLVYTSTWNGPHSLPFHVSLCHQLWQFCQLGTKTHRGVTYRHASFLQYLQGTKIHVIHKRGLESWQSSFYKFTHALSCASIQTHPCSSSLLSSLCTSQESAHNQTDLLCPHPGCLHTHRPLTQAHM